MIGVDFSGAAEAGRTAWLAELSITDNHPPLQLRTLRPIGRLAGSDRRADVCRYLSDRILASRQTLWSIDFPFGLPVELGLGSWKQQLRGVIKHRGTARDYGLQLVERSRERTGKMHVRRQTDKETKTPFDCFHYRIIYQTFHGMRDVLAPLAEDPRTAVLPFQYAKWDRAERQVVEACPSSTLKRLELPHRNYKQSGGRPPTAAHRRTRRRILGTVAGLVQVSRYRRRVVMDDPGGDALDAIVAGLGGWLGMRRAPHAAIARHRRYPREGRVYC